MKFPRVRTILLTPLVLFALFYLVLVVWVALLDDSIAILADSPAPHETIAIFGASGAAGDGILKAALAAPDIKKMDRKFYRVIETWRRKKGRWILLSGLNRRPLHGPEVFAA